MLEKSEIRFLPLGARRVAYEMRGDGPPLVAPAWWVSHLELDWQSAGFRRFWEGVADGYTLIRYDRLGVGMSDRTLQDSDLTIDEEVATLRALLDELSSSACRSSAAHAGAAPQSPLPQHFRSAWSAWCCTGRTPTAQRLRLRVWPMRFSRRYARIGDSARACSATCSSRGPTLRSTNSFARFQRESTSAETAAALLGLVYRLDVRAQLPLVRPPALVVHRRDDRAVPFRLGREVAAAIPGATFIPLQGSAHFPWHGDVDSVVRACREALAPGQSSPHDASEPERVLLSSREREVLACVARGLSDREIAEQLVLSSHTVHRHVANIRRKLGRTSRTAAVAEAARLGLL